jgi:hypothetical protein
MISLDPMKIDQTFKLLSTGAGGLASGLIIGVGCKQLIAAGSLQGIGLAIFILSFGCILAGLAFSEGYRVLHPRSGEYTVVGLASVEDRLDELERLKRRDMVTPEEYAAKRQEILKDL